MVPLDPGLVIFSFKDGFTQHDEWPGESDVIGCSPFLPDIIKGLPSLFSEGTLEKTMLRGFRGLLRANLACGEDPHALQPDAYREAPVKGEPYESTDLLGLGVMLDSGHNLHDDAVLKV
jgi:hypothetical protein